ncbi:MAG TPA: ABC transporter substrate-binding protein [Terriglobales bacterium]|jgi:ABC-type uncharacterized transport system substrate-binding protein|nr:ABC transporter substrate-binding protein [Terriglobales bacterium]
MMGNIFFWLLTTLLLTTDPSAQAQQPTIIPRIAYLSAASHSAIAARVEAFRQGLRELGYVEGKNIFIEWRFGDGKSDRLPSLAAELVRLKVDVIVAVLVLASPVNFSQCAKIVNFAARNRIPTIYPEPEYMDAGGLMLYAVNVTELFSRAAVYVDKILKGARVADLPVEQPTKFEFVVNLKTAKQIRLTIPPNVLARADRVIR